MISLPPTPPPLLVRCSLHGAGALERLCFLLENELQPDHQDRMRLARDVFDANGAPPTLDCPRISLFGAQTDAPLDTAHALAVIATTLGSSSLEPRPADDRIKNKSLKARVFRDYGMVVLPHPILEPLTVEYSPDRCTSLTPAQPLHHDLMAPDTPGADLEVWITKATNAVISALEPDGGGSWYRVLDPTCLKSAPLQIAFSDMVERACAFCEQCYGAIPLDEPAPPPAWTDTSRFTAAEQRRRLQHLRALVHEAQSRIQRGELAPPERPTTRAPRAT